MMNLGKKEMKYYSALQFAWMRILLGGYLVIHFLQLLPFAPDIWSQTGMMPDPASNLTYGMFPNLLYIFDTPLQTQLFIGVAALLSLAIMLGFKRRVAALLLWYCWACLFHRNNLITNPGLPMVGWLLLAFVLVPGGEPLRLGGKKRNRDWYMPAPLFWGAWALLAVSYTLSGLDKLGSQSWVDGNALYYLLQNPLARDSMLRNLLLDLPRWCFSLLTWGTLALEIGFGFLCLSKKARPVAWFAMVAMHLGIILLIDFADLTLGVLMLHFFVYDPRWLGKRVAAEKPIVFFDGICGLCNKSIDLLLGMDRRGALRFAPLQGQTAAAVLEQQMVTRLDSMVFMSGGKIYTQSDAPLQILRTIGGPWAWCYPLRMIPKAWRDVLYRQVAKNRYRLFGKHESCRIPTPAERARFLE